MAKKVVTFGEIMLRLAPNGYYRFFQNDQLQATFGGGEANVAVSLANFGLDAAYVTRLPAHSIGQAAVDSLRHFGVDTRRALPSGEACASMTVLTPPSRRPAVGISTGTPFLRVQTGSISQASLRPWVRIW